MERIVLQCQRSGHPVTGNGEFPVAYRIAVQPALRRREGALEEPVFSMLA